MKLAAIAACLSLLMAFCSGAPIHASESGESHPPTSYYKPMPATPVETAGTGLGPLVTARLRIDARGKVTSVSVVGVEPKSAHDALFERASKEALFRWRFLPAVKAGRPVEAEIPVSIRFEPVSYARKKGSGYWMEMLTSDLERDERRIRYLTLPEDQRHSVLREMSERAESIITPAGRSAAESDAFTVVTDLPQPGAAQRILQNLEAVFSSNISIFRKVIPVQPSKGKISAYVFSSRDQYQNMIADVDGFEWTAGFYSPIGMLAFHAEWPTGDHLLSVLVHEATHALMDRHLVRQGVLLPRWLDEGFADYMGNSDIKDGRLAPGSHKKRIAELRFAPALGEVRFDSAARLDAETAKQAVRQERALTLAEVVSSTPELFYGDNRHLYYSQAWLVVHFLRHGRPSWSDEEFPRLVLYAAEGFNTMEAFRKVYGQDLTSLDAEYRAYIDRF